MIRHRNITLLILDNNETKKIQVRRWLVKNFKLIILIVVLLFISLLSALFYFVYNYSYTQFIVRENQKLLAKNYDLTQQIASLGKVLRKKNVSRNTDELDSGDVLVNFIKPYLGNKSVGG